MATDLRARVASFFTGICVFAWTLRPIWDDDIFMHIAVGREVLAHGLPTRDVFSSATPNAPWVPFQLGYELVLALVERVAGLYGANALHALVIAIAAAGLVQLFSRQTGSRSATWLLLSLFLLLFDERVRPRPHVFNLLFEAFVLLPLAAQELVPRRPRHVLSYFVAGAVWGFFHSMGALWLCATLGAFVVGSPEPQVRKHALYSTLAAFAGIFVTPTNFAGMQHVLLIQDQWKEFVPELGTSFVFISVLGGPYGVLLTLLPLIACVAVVLALREKPARERYPTLLVAAGLAFASVWLCRLCYYAAFVLLLVWPELSRASWLRENVRVPLRRAGFVLSAAILLVLFAHVTPRYFAFHMLPWTKTIQPRAFPVAEAAALRKAGIGGAVFNEMAWGGFLLYQLHPEARMLTDGRITFDRDVAEIIRRIDRYEVAVLAEVAYDRFGTDLLIWRRGRMRPSSHWQLLLEGPLAQVWSRSGPAFEQRQRALEHAGVLRHESSPKP